VGAIWPIKVPKLTQQPLVKEKPTTDSFGLNEDSTSPEYLRIYGKEFKTIDPHYWEKRYVDEAPYNFSVLVISAA